MDAYIKHQWDKYWNGFRSNLKYRWYQSKCRTFKMDFHLEDPSFGICPEDPKQIKDFLM